MYVCSTTLSTKFSYVIGIQGMHFQKTPGLAQVIDKLYHKITSGRGTAYPSGAPEFTPLPV